MKNKKSHFAIEILIISVILINNLFAQEVVKAWEEPLVIPTYKIAPANVNPMFFRGESYQGASKVVYPYALNDIVTGNKEDKTYKALYLENEYIKLCILPELGGKLYDGLDKTNNYHFFYRNNVIKPTNIGMFGAWTSGGIEWCVLHHHRASTFLPVDYQIVENKDGSKTIYFGETEPRQQIKWTIGITIFPGKSYLQADVKIINRKPNTYSFLYWANVATNANENYRVIFPPSTDHAVYHAKNSFCHWPVTKEIYNGSEVYKNGFDASWWKNHPEPISFFCHNLKEDFMGGYDYGKNAGTVHVGNHNIIKGSKLWEWGPGKYAQMWDKILTDNDGPYAEIMVGAYSDNQPDYSWLRPYEVKSFKQFWYPVRNTNGFKNANLHAAVNLEIVNPGTAKIGVYATFPINSASVKLINNSNALLDKTLDLSPDKPFEMDVKLPKGIKEYDLKIVVTNKEGKELISYQPKEKIYKDELPETVQPPAKPEDIKTTEELYLTGLRIRQFHNPTIDARLYFNEALKRDSFDIRTNTFLGLDARQRGDYPQALKYLRTAVKRLTKDWTRPSNCEALYGLGLVLKNLEKYDDAIDTLYRATWDYAFHSAAFYDLAEISSIQGNYPLALEQIDNSISTNTRNTKAKGLKCLILRNLNKFEESITLANEIISFDPLDSRALYELFLSLKSKNDKAGSDKALKDWKNLLKDFDQSYLELAADYANCGSLKEAIQILTYAIDNEKNGIRPNPEVHYYLGYLNEKTRKKDLALQFYQSGSKLPTDYCFPYRLESINVFTSAINSVPNDSKAYYYLGNLLYDKQPAKAIECWEKAVNLDPAFAIAFRNLGWGYFYSQNIIPKSIDMYEKAIAGKNDDPIYYLELDRLYQRNNTNLDKRLQLMENKHNVLVNRDDAFIREIMVLTLAGKYDKVIEYISKETFHVREGDESMRDINVNAHTLRGLSFLKQKNYKEALQDFLKANEYPENQQVGPVYKDPRIVQVNYLIGLGYENIGDKKKSKEFYILAANGEMWDSQFLYYQGLAWQKIGNTAKANETFDKLSKMGEDKLKSGEAVDFFAKFGEKSDKNAMLSEAHLLCGLGYLGKGEKIKAKEEIKKAVDLNISNLWANYYLNNE